MFSLADSAFVVWLPRRRGGPARFAALWPDLRENLHQVRVAERQAMSEDGSASDPGTPSPSVPRAA